MKEYTVSQLQTMAWKVKGYDGNLENYCYDVNGENFFQTYFSDNLDELARAICYGEYKYGDDYVKFNGYGNLESIDQFEYEFILIDNEEEIVETYNEYVENNYIEGGDL